ncbi:hypothetical protein [Treponema sp. R80B11-R83G3]
MPTVKKKMNMEENMDSESVRISWHPAFVEALQMELQEYQDVLEFHPEYQLTSEPLRIDCVVIKKTKEAVIKKNIAVIFKEWNLMEYKSPEDYVSVADFYKVYGYACLYASFNKVPITSLTVSFVESRYPKKLLKHLKYERGYNVAKTSFGIYTVSGNILPIQVIDSSKLSAEENLWLKSLSDKLGYEEFSRVSDEIERQGKAARLGAYFYVISGANKKAMKEVIKKMKNTFHQVLEETGLKSSLEERKSFSIAQNMVKLGLPIEIVISATQLDPEKVKTLYQEKVVSGN